VKRQRISKRLLYVLFGIIGLGLILSLFTTDSEFPIHYSLGDIVNPFEGAPFDIFSAFSKTDATCRMSQFIDAKDDTGRKVILGSGGIVDQSPSLIGLAVYPQSQSIAIKDFLLRFRIGCSGIDENIYVIGGTVNVKWLATNSRGTVIKVLDQTYNIDIEKDRLQPRQLDVSGTTVNLREVNIKAVDFESKLNDKTERFNSFTQSDVFYNLKIKIEGDDRTWNLVGTSRTATTLVVQNEKIQPCSKRCAPPDSPQIILDVTEPKDGKLSRLKTVYVVVKLPEWKDSEGLPTLTVTHESSTVPVTSFKLAKTGTSGDASVFQKRFIISSSHEGVFYIKVSLDGRNTETNAVVYDPTPAPKPPEEIDCDAPVPPEHCDPPEPPKDGDESLCREDEILYNLPDMFVLFGYTTACLNDAQLQALLLAEWFFDGWKIIWIIAGVIVLYIIYKGVAYATRDRSISRIGYR